METQEYRSGVGKLLYLVKLSRPDLALSVRELAKFMDGSTLDHYQAMRRVMEYAVSTAEERLILAPNMMDEGVLTGYTDSYYASDKGSRKSVSGVAIYFCGGLVSWRSKAQQCSHYSLFHGSRIRGLLPRSDGNGVCPSDFGIHGGTSEATYATECG